MTGIAAGIVVLGVGDGSGLWEYHQRPAFCGLCHIMNPYVETWNGSELLANSHADVDVTCLDCHEPTPDQQVQELVAFVRGAYEDPLEQRKFDKEFCLKCHEHESYGRLIELTAHLEEGVGANPHDSHFGHMECRSCHNVHRDSVDYCASCHVWGWDVP